MVTARPNSRYTRPSDCGSDVSAAPYRTPAISQLTMAGQLIGTPAYMSPEQAAGKEVDERADVFSFGAILHELITGAPMYSGETTTGIIERARKGDSAPLMRKVLGIRRDRIFSRRSDGLVAIVERATAFDPAERYRNGSELAAALRVDREAQRIRSRLDWTDLLVWMVSGIWIADWLPSGALSFWLLAG